MPTTTVLRRGPLSVTDYRCNAGPADAPYPELHGAFTISYVRRGSFGVETRGR
ncbi:MAG: AraC family transcriptional regulator, partial [Deltaproteobacteria bacterium]